MNAGDAPGAVKSTPPVGNDIQIREVYEIMRNARKLLERGLISDTRSYFYTETIKKYGKERGKELIRAVLEKTRAAKMEAQQRAPQNVQMQESQRGQPYPAPPSQHITPQNMQMPKMQRGQPYPAVPSQHITPQNMQMQESQRGQPYTAPPSQHITPQNMQMQEMQRGQPYPAVPNQHITPQNVQMQESQRGQPYPAVLNSHITPQTMQMHERQRGQPYPAPPSQHITPQNMKMRGTQKSDEQPKPEPTEYSAQQNTEVAKDVSATSKRGQKTNKKAGTAKSVDGTNATVDDDTEKVDMTVFSNGGDGGGNDLSIEVVRESDLKDEADGCIRSSLSNQTVPGVAANVTQGLSRTAPSNTTNADNLRDTIHNVANDVLKSRNFSATPKAMKLLYDGLQMHITSIVDAAGGIRRKRTNHFICEHFKELEKRISETTEDEFKRRRALHIAWGPDFRCKLDGEIASRSEELKRRYLVEEEGLKAEIEAQDEERRAGQRKRGSSGTSSETKEPWWKREEKERECGMLSWEDLATLSKKNAVAEKYELGPHQSRKKSRTQKIDGGGAQMSAADSSTPGSTLGGEYDQKDPLVNSTRTSKGCPLLDIEKDSRSGSIPKTVNHVDVSAAILRGTGTHLSGGICCEELGSTVRVVKSTPRRKKTA